MNNSKSKSKGFTFDETTLPSRGQKKSLWNGREMFKSRLIATLISAASVSLILI